MAVYHETSDGDPREVSVDTTGEIIEVKISPSSGIGKGDPIVCRFKGAFVQDSRTVNGVQLDKRLTSTDLADNPEIAKMLAEKVVSAVDASMEAINSARKNIDILMAIIRATRPTSLNGIKLNIDDGGLGVHREYRTDYNDGVVVKSPPPISQPDEVWFNEYWVGGLEKRLGGPPATYVLELDPDGKFLYEQGRGMKYVKV